MEYNNIIFEIKNKIGYITLNRPQAMNSLSIPLLQELSAALDELDLNPDVWGVIITGNDKAFCAGADLTGNHVISSAQNKYEGHREKFRWIHGIFNRIENFQHPVIAAINGYALGGGNELAMCCDIRIAGEKAIFGQPETGLGAIACYGGPQRLPRLVGTSMAKELLYTGRKINAQQAKEIGLVSRVVPQENLMAEAEALMAEIFKQAPIAVKYTKVCVNRGVEMPLDYALELELDLVTICVQTDDAKEGVAAFREKRKPVFKNQ